MPEAEALPAVKPPMPDKLRPLALAAIARHQKRAAAPEVVSKPDHGHYERLTCPYRDEDEGLWFALILECFGTRLADVGQSFMHQLAALCPEVLYEGEQHQRVDEDSLRQALEIVYSLKPRSAAEAALAAQAVAVHFAAMKVGKFIGGHSYTDPRTAAALAALVKAYRSSLETMRKLKGGRSSTRQTIKVAKDVHYHNHYHDERHVHVPGRGAGKSGSQAHETDRPRARATPALPGPEEGRRELRVVPDEGEEALSPARRG